MTLEEGTRVLRRRDWGELAGLFAEQRDAYALLLALSRGQHAAFEKDGTRGLTKVIARKQSVISLLETLDSKLLPYTASWQATMAALPEPARREVKALVTEISDLIRDIMTSERDIEKEVTRARDALSEKARGVSTGLVAAKAYEKPGLAAAGGIIDREG